MSTRLVSGNVELDLVDKIPTPVTYSIADIFNPDKRTRNFSKTITLAGTQSNSLYFASAFSFSSSNNVVTFDPTVKVSAQVYKGQVRIMDGVLQLVDVTTLDDKDLFTVRVYGEVTDGFLIMKNVLVSELDWSAYTHTLTQANIVATFTTPIGSGYKYKLIERGNGRVGASIWRNTDLIPYVYFKEVLEKVLALGNIKFTSAFMETDRFKSILFGYGGGEVPSVSIQDLDDRIVDVNAGDYNYDRVTVPVINQFNQSVSQFPSEDVDGTNFTGTVIQDTLLQFNDAEITCQVTGTYRLDVSLILDYAYDVGTMTYLNGRSPWVKLLKNGSEIDSSQAWAPAASFIPTQTGTGDYSFSKQLVLQSGDQIQLRIEPSYCITDTFTDPTRLTISTNTPITIDLTSLDTALTDGSTIEVGRFLPNMTCADFLSGALRQFYLYISEPNDDGVVTIEPLPEFYKPTNEFDDISDLIDYSKPFKREPSSNTYPKKTSFTYKEMKEFDALEYFDKWERRYGDYIHKQGSHLATGELKIPLPWATIIPNDIFGGLLVPRFITKDDNGVIKPNRGAARIMMDNGMKAGSWSLRNLTVPWNQTNRTTYPSVHHFDDYENPTFDLNFSLVDELFYVTTQVTTVNSYSEYYYESVNEITARSGTLVTCYVRYNPLDIRNLDFSKLKMRNGKLFRLLKVFDFDDDVQFTTKIQMLKVLDAKNSRRVDVAVPPRDRGIGVSVSESPSGVGVGFPLVTGGVNSVDEQSILSIGS